MIEGQPESIGPQLFVHYLFLPGFPPPADSPTIVRATRQQELRNLVTGSKEARDKY